MRIGTFSFSVALGSSVFLLRTRNRHTSQVSAGLVGPDLKKGTPLTMASQIQKNFRARKTFAKLKQVIEIPNLIDIQKRSYDKFLQIDIPVDKREDIGLQGVFKSVFPIKDFSETSSLEFVSYNLEKPKYDVDECRARGMTFAAPIKVVIRLVVWDVNEETGVQSIRT